MQRTCAKHKVACNVTDAASPSVGAEINVGILCTMWCRVGRRARTQVRGCALGVCVIVVSGLLVYPMGSMLHAGDRDACETFHTARPAGRTIRAPRPPAKRKLHRRLSPPPPPIVASGALAMAVASRLVGSAADGGGRGGIGGTIAGRPPVDERPCQWCGAGCEVCAACCYPISVVSRHRPPVFPSCPSPCRAHVSLPFPHSVLRSASCRWARCPRPCLCLCLLPLLSSPPSIVFCSLFSALLLSSLLFSSRLVSSLPLRFSLSLHVIPLLCCSLLSSYLASSVCANHPCSSLHFPLCLSSCTPS